MRSFLLLLPIPLIALWVVYSGLAYEPDELELSLFQGPVSLIRLPEEAAGFKKRDGVRAYGRDNLYEYVNGHAEFFLSYGFASLTVADYSSGKGEIIVELYDMENADNAGGALAAEKGGAQKLDLDGVTAWAQKGFLLFAKGRYYVKLGYFNIGDDKEVASLGGELASMIKDEISGIEKLLLPVAGKVKGSELFVKSDYLGLGFLNDVNTAKYKIGGEELEGFQFGKPPEEMLSFFKGEGAEIISSDINGLKRFVIRDKYEGTIHLITDGKDTVGIKGKVDGDSPEDYIKEAGIKIKG